MYSLCLCYLCFLSLLGWLYCCLFLYICAVYGEFVLVLNSSLYKLDKTSGHAVMTEQGTEN